MGNKYDNMNALVAVLDGQDPRVITLEELHDLLPGMSRNELSHAAGMAAKHSKTPFVRIGLGKFRVLADGENVANAKRNQMKITRNRKGSQDVAPTEVPQCDLVQKVRVLKDNTWLAECEDGALWKVSFRRIDV